MAKADTVQQSDLLRVLYVGNSGSGKTGSLISLLQAGYEIRMLDMDHNCKSLIELCKKHNPELLKQLDVISVRDKFRASQLSGVEVSGQPKAFVDMLKLMNKWDDESVPGSWPSNTIFVVDTLTSVGRAAFHWAKGMNPSAKDPRQWYAAAGEALVSFLEMITSPAFANHVIVLSHIDEVERPDGMVQGYASSLGKALGPKIPKVFSTMVMAERKGTGSNVRRTIQTMPTQMMDLKSPIPWALEKELPLETGMATIFEKLLG